MRIGFRQVTFGTQQNNNRLPDISQQDQQLLAQREPTIFKPTAEGGVERTGLSKPLTILDSVTPQALAAAAEEKSSSSEST